MFIPSKISDVIQNKKNLIYLNNFFKKNNKEPILCLGPSGSGKSFIINLFCKKFKLNIFYFNSSTICNDENKKIINKLLEQQNLSTFYKKNSKNTIIIIDNVHLLNSKNLIEKFINQKKHYCFFIGHNIHFKYKNILKKLIKNHLEFKKPTVSDFIKYLKKFSNESNIKLSKCITDIKLKKIFKKLDKDYKQFQYFLSSLNNINNKEWTFNLISDFIQKNQSKKNVNYELYESTYKILYYPLSIDKSLEIMGNEPFLISKMLQENYIIAYFNTQKNNKLSLKKLTEYIMYANQLEYYYEPLTQKIKNILYSYPINIEISNLSKKNVPSLNFTKSLNINTNDKECKYKKLFPFDLNGTFFFDDELLHFFMKLKIKTKKIKDKNTIFNLFKSYFKLNDDYKKEFKKIIPLINK